LSHVLFCLRDVVEAQCQLRTKQRHLAPPVINQARPVCVGCRTCERCASSRVIKTTAQNRTRVDPYANHCSKRGSTAWPLRNLEHLYATQADPAAPPPQAQQRTRRMRLFKLLVESSQTTLKRKLELTASSGGRIARTAPAASATTHGAATGWRGTGVSRFCDLSHNTSDQPGSAEQPTSGVMAAAYLVGV
jgi:hypothetical protein